MVNILSAFIQSKLFSNLCYALVLIYALPFVLTYFYPTKVQKAVQTKVPGHGDQVKKNQTPRAIKYSKSYVVFMNVLLYVGIVGHIVLATICFLFHPKNYVFHVPLPDFVRALAEIINVLFAIVYVWSLILLNGKYRIFEGHGIPYRLVKKGPYSETRHPVCFSRSAMLVASSVALECPIMLLPSLMGVYASIRLSIEEEKQLHQGLTREHIGYCQKVRRFLPKNWKKYLI
ncbi:uncharacterized protein MONOS_9766 [Monocercomonoides exilis]|uniref:uncharacterized protein n=1 Tax=Monocercomonoides exilis TaxID=2049356 RepID=UPI00355A1A2D|nr:hypothetical protein MONOS_9766 [Monocercomonoides exilis]|eukprot:MONOS_9766.1-p1 / transcript=MONOS_9766.1 / gene=MONOS_9766 / organism=Monocercomonoides_exilis_PA203 / gene_product=unspecified product / transcript_product=unspecified product / location=Mono_scaffold00416:16002-16694(-) / protein_length=231 / sequence_SO=supercontig / SO=protein_coding / is_pseudo=false